ncbi:MAG TPA: hypothetical protein VKE26_26355 [Xanthobacteraceae bacterium]|nr:hypothetical protein [Xanthobacteraceae bacterium]
MATLSTGNVTMLDWAKRTDPMGKVMVIVELLSQTNEILEDAVWREGNLPTGERTTVRTGLPTVYWRMINQGVPTSKSTTAQVDEMCGMLEAWSEVDADLATLGNDLNGFRMSEATAFLEAMNQELAQTIIYGNAGLAPEEFTGLAPRYSSLSAGNAENIIDAGGSQSDNTSIWLVAWGDETVYGVFPAGSKAGLYHQDLGQETVEVTAGVAGSRMLAFRERYQWKAGLCVKDWRYVVRIANIDASDLVGATPPDLVDFMEQADEIIPNRLGKRVFYVNRRVSRILRKIARTDVTAGGGLTFENFAGKPVLTFGGVPVRKVDAILNTEARVT